MLYKLGAAQEGQVVKKEEEMEEEEEEEEEKEMEEVKVEEEMEEKKRREKRERRREKKKQEEEEKVKTVPVGLSSSFQLLLRGRERRQLQIGFKLEGGRNVQSSAVLRNQESLYILAQDMSQLKCFVFDETTLTVTPARWNHS